MDDADHLPPPASAHAQALTPTQERLLGLLRRPAEPLVFDEGFVDDLVGEATDAIAHFSARLGGERVWMNKTRLANVHGCEEKYLLPDDFTWSTVTVAGHIAHRAIELALNWRGEPVPADVVDEAIARAGEGSDDRARFVAGLTDGQRADLRSRTIDRTTKFLQDFPPLPRESQPVLEASARWQANGTIELTGKVDLAVGKPHGRESRILIVDFKSGSRSPAHREDLRFYALVETLRRRVPPRKVASYYLDFSDSDAEDVTEGTLRSALARTLDGIERHVELTIEGRPPVRKKGTPCRWCPLRETCPDGRDFLQTDGDD